MDLGLQGKVAIITGTNNPQGIGAATAYALAREGVRLVLVYKRMAHAYREDKTDANGYDRYHKANSGDAAQVADTLARMGAECLVLEADISAEEQAADIFARARGRFGRVDILVNNAAHYEDEDTIDTLTARGMDATFATNVRGSLLMTREFVHQHPRDGRVIMLSTDAAQAFAGQITYGASKAALEALTRSLALETARHGITVNCIAPGPTQTGWIDAEFEQSVIKDMPMGALIEPHDIANAIVFLCSPRARYITGQVIKVSGGHNL